MLALLLLACSSGPTAEPEAPAAAPAGPVPAAAPAPAVPAPPAADPAAYGDKVLVILSSSLHPGAAPDGLALAAQEPGVALARLDSTAFKGLMPCYEIVVAGAFADVGAARELSSRLKARGVDHYLKPAGAWVGARPELDRACAARRSPPPVGGTVAFVHGPGARLPFAPEIEAQAVATSPPLRPLDASGSAWSAPLTVHAMEPWTVGDELPGIDASGRLVQCRLERFVKGVAGTPHWGWVQAGSMDAPGCGDEHLYAQVGCDAVVVLPAGSRPQGALPRGPGSTEAPPDLPVAWQLELGQRRSLAEEVGTVQVAWEVSPLRLGERDLRRVQVRLWTDEGDRYCGGEDFVWSAAGLLDAQGAAVLGLVETTGWQAGPVLAVEPGGEPLLYLVEELTGSQRLVGAALDLANEVPYCDCPC
ncbi:hypothetical protein L6R53_08625 [Myxococcota bacterium]|nr:hypothetical protein [Myxococcota bacterium]